MTDARLTDELESLRPGRGWGEDPSRSAAFEEAIAGRLGARHAIAVASPQVAFLCAYRAAGAPEGSTVLATSLADPTVARAAVATGHRLRFADVDVRGHQAAAAVARHVALHGVPTILVPSHYAGNPCDVASLAAAAPSALVIEDAIDALGAIGAEGRPIGSPGPAAMTVVGVHPLRASTPAQAAVVLTDDATLAARCRRVRDECPDHRMSELHAALALVELGRLAGIVGARGRTAARYDETLATHALAAAVPPTEGTQSAWWSYLVRVPAWARSAAEDALGRQGVTARRVSLLLHRHPYFGRSADVLPAELPATERFAVETLLLPTATTDEATFPRAERLGIRPPAPAIDLRRVALAG